MDRGQCGAIRGGLAVRCHLALCGSKPHVSTAFDVRLFRLRPDSVFVRLLLIECLLCVRHGTRHGYLFMPLNFCCRPVQWMNLSILPYGGSRRRETGLAWERSLTNRGAGLEVAPVRPTGAAGDWPGPQALPPCADPSSTRIVFCNRVGIKSNIVQAGFKITIFFNHQIYFFHPVLTEITPCGEWGSPRVMGALALRPLHLREEWGQGLALSSASGGGYLDVGW